jgi:hypothetical protein
MSLGSKLFMAMVETFGDDNLKRKSVGVLTYSRERRSFFGSFLLTMIKDR